MIPPNKCLDFAGQELHEGDIIAYTYVSSSSGHIKLGKILRITTKDDIWYDHKTQRNIPYTKFAVLVHGIEQKYSGGYEYNVRHSTLQYPDRTIKIEDITRFDFALIKMLDDITLLP